MRQRVIVIPASLHDKAIAHDGHQGISKTKKLLRTKVWFPRLKKFVELKIDGKLRVKYTIQKYYMNR